MSATAKQSTIDYSDSASACIACVCTQFGWNFLIRAMVER
jgi:hypothetical protein